MPTERLSFPGHTGVTLDARLERPDGEPRAYAIFAPCFTCGMEQLAASRIARALAAAGIATLRLDFTGVDAEHPEPKPSGISGDAEDLRLAAAHMAERGWAPELLVGHSLGGAAVLAAAPTIASVRAVATLNAPADAAHVIRQFEAAVAEIEATGRATVRLAGRPFTLTRDFLDDVRRHAGAARPLNGALLVMHAPGDETVSIDNAGAIFQAAHHPKSFVALANADHLLTRAEDTAYAARVIAAWAERYLSPAVAVR